MSNADDGIDAGADADAMESEGDYRGVNDFPTQQWSAAGLRSSIERNSKNWEGDMTGIAATYQPPTSQGFTEHRTGSNETTEVEDSDDVDSSMGCVRFWNESDKENRVLVTDNYRINAQTRVNRRTPEQDYVPLDDDTEMTTEDSEESGDETERENHAQLRRNATPSATNPTHAAASRNAATADSKAAIELEDEAIPAPSISSNDADNEDNMEDERACQAGMWDLDVDVDYTPHFRASNTLPKIEDDDNRRHHDLASIAILPSSHRSRSRPHCRWRQLSSSRYAGRR